MSAIPTAFDPLGTLAKTALPAGYTALNYIESTGTQWIDTAQDGQGGWLAAPSGNYTISMTVTDTTHGRLFSVIATENRPALSIYRNPNQAFRFTTPYNDSGIEKGRLRGSSASIVVNTGDTYTLSATPVNGTLNDMEFNGVVYRYGTTVGSLSSEAIICSIKPMIIGANVHTYTGESPQSADIGAGRYHRVSLWNEGELVHDAVPCLDAQGRPCLYDLVTKITYYNSGTGEFDYA